MASPPRILVVRNDKLGDLLLAWPALALLRASLPGARLDVLVPEYTREAAELCPSVDGVVLDPGPEAGAAALVERLRAGGYDALLTLFSTGRVAWAGWRAGIPYRLAPATKWAQVLYTERLTQRRSRSEQPEHAYNTDLARHLVRHLGAEPVEVEAPYLAFEAGEVRARGERLRAELGLGAEPRLVFVHAGHGGSARNLSLEQYAALGRALESDRGHALVLTAGPGERATAERLGELLGPGVPHAVYESTAGLGDFARCVAAADAFVAGSTGTLHLAGALDVPTAGFYPRRRSSTPLRWQTLSRPERRLAWSPAEGVHESDMGSIDVEAAAREVSARFLGAVP